MHGDSDCQQDMSAVGGGTINNELGAAIQHSIKSNQGSRGIPSYSPLSVGLGGSRIDLEINHIR